MKANSIDRVVVSKTNHHNNNALWIDTSNGEKSAVLKYKGNPLVGGGSGSGGGNIMFKNLLATEDLSPEQQRLVNNAIRAAGLRNKIPGSVFIPVESPLDLPLAIQYPDEEVPGGSVLFLSNVSYEEDKPAIVIYVHSSGDIYNFVAIEGGFGSYMNGQM